MSVRTSSWTVLAARFLVSCIFVLSGITKLGSLAQTAQMISSHGLPAAEFLAVVAACVEVLGGLAILLGFGATAGAALLALYLVPTTLVFHDFWRFTGLEYQMQMIQFLKNLAIGGGLLYVVAHGAGEFSVDRWLDKHAKLPRWWPRRLSSTTP
jgi:putative oxidoreductase